MFLESCKLTNLNTKYKKFHQIVLAGITTINDFFLFKGAGAGAGYQVGVEGEIASTAGGEQDEGQEPGGQEPGGQEGQKGHAALSAGSSAVQYCSCLGPT